MTSCRIGWICCLVFCCVSPLQAEEPPLSVSEYRGALEVVLEQLKAKRWTDAAQSADRLRLRRVVAGRNSFATDASLLGPLAQPLDDAKSAPFRARLQNLIAFLRSREGTDGGGTVFSPDHGVLERIREEQEKTLAQAKGQVTRPEVAVPDSVEHLGAYLWRKICAAFRSLGNAFVKLLEWLFEGRNRDRTSGSPSEWVGPVTIMLILAFLGFLSLFILDVIRRNRRGHVPIVTPAVQRSPRADEDPTSRVEQEWLNYAEELMRDERAREAVRAYYHAVLAALFTAGVLHYRRGRTNWEYYRELSTEWSWRAEFRDITSLFERVWYGHQELQAEKGRAFAARARNVLGQLRASKEAQT